MNKKIISIFIVFFLVIGFGLQVSAQAPGVNSGQQQPPAPGVNSGPQQPPTPSSGGATVAKIQNPINVSDFSGFVSRVLGIILRVAIPIVAAFIIYSGLMFVLARGNTEKLEQAKTRFLYTLIGAAILLGAWMIATVVESTIKALTA